MKSAAAAILRRRKNRSQPGLPCRASRAVAARTFEVTKPWKQADAIDRMTSPVRLIQFQPWQNRAVISTLE